MSQSVITATITHPDAKEEGKTVSKSFAVEVRGEGGGSTPMPTSENKDLIGNFEYAGVHDHGDMEPSVQTELERSVEKAGEEINVYLSELIDLLPKKQQQQKKEKKRRLEK